MLHRAIDKAYAYNKKPLCDLLSDWREADGRANFAFERLSEFINRRCNGANKAPPDLVKDWEDLVIAHAKVRLRKMAGANGGQPLPRGTDDRVIREVIAMLVDVGEFPPGMPDSKRVRNAVRRGKRRL
jgi:hypothetical protein